MKSYLKKGLLIASLICGIAAYSQAMVPLRSVVGSTQPVPQEFIVELINNSTKTIECPIYTGQFLNPGETVEIHMEKNQMDMWLNYLDLSGTIYDISCSTTGTGAYIAKSFYDWINATSSNIQTVNVISDICMPGKCNAALVYPNKRGYIIMTFKDLPAF